eukprot:358152-Chlamydomonas_euryale.AAC.3
MLRAAAASAAAAAAATAAAPGPHVGAVAPKVYAEGLEPYRRLYRPRPVTSCPPSATGGGFGGGSPRIGTCGGSTASSVAASPYAERRGGNGGVTLSGGWPRPATARRAAPIAPATMFAWHAVSEHAERCGGGVEVEVWRTRPHLHVRVHACYIAVGDHLHNKPT